MAYTFALNMDADLIKAVINIPYKYQNAKMAYELLMFGSKLQSTLTYELCGGVQTTHALNI